MLSALSGTIAEPGRQQLKAALKQGDNTL